VYAGVDPLTHRRHYLLELASTRAEAELVRTGPYLDRPPLGDRCADVVGVLDAGRYARNETFVRGPWLSRPSTAFRLKLRGEFHCGRSYPRCPPMSPGEGWSR
jgi:hypothetical protein